MKSPTRAGGRTGDLRDPAPLPKIPTMQRVGALCLLLALVALHAPAALVAVTGGRDHHHPGCPWEARHEPCPHRMATGTPEAPAWAPCPSAVVGLAAPAGPDVAPPGGEIDVPGDPPPACASRPIPGAEPRSRASEPEVRPPI